MGQPESRRPASTLTLHIGGVSHTGRYRQDNQDSIGWTALPVGSPQTDSHVALLADGLGGHAGGAAASQRAIQWILTHLARHQGTPDAAVARWLLEGANQAVYELATEMGLAGNMGTTGVLALFNAAQAVVAHVGDSRLYLVRYEVCRQVTADHSFVWTLLAKGAIGQGEMASHPHRGAITRCLGIAPEVEVEVEEPPIPLQEGDRFILCSDGLTEVIADPELATLTRGRPSQEAAQLLVDTANRRGTRDNVSAIVAVVGLADDLETTITTG